MAKAVEIKCIRENPMTGGRTWEFRSGFDTVREWAMKEFGTDIIDIARGGRINAKGLFTFRSGIGYDIISSDLFGGKADGQLRSKFEEETDTYISYK